MFYIFFLNFKFWKRKIRNLTGKRFPEPTGNGKFYRKPVFSVRKTFPCTKYMGKIIYLINYEQIWTEYISNKHYRSLTTWIHKNNHLNTKSTHQTHGSGRPAAASTRETRFLARKSPETGRKTPESARPAASARGGGGIRSYRSKIGARWPDSGANRPKSPARRPSKVSCVGEELRLLGVSG